MTTREVDVLLTAQRFDGRLRKAGAHEWTAHARNAAETINSPSIRLATISAMISSAFWTSLRAWDR